VGKSPERFAELVNVFLNGPYRVTQRAVWPLSYCIEKNPSLLSPHLKKILTILQNQDVHDSVKRNIFRMLQFSVIPKAHQGTVVDLGFNYLSNANEPIAVRVFAMTVLANIAHTVPELKNELIPIIEDQLPFGSAGFVSRGNKILKQLKK
jgi:hypothetical protein